MQDTNYSVRSRRPRAAFSKRTYELTLFQTLLLKVIAFKTRQHKLSGSYARANCLRPCCLKAGVKRGLERPMRELLQSSRKNVMQHEGKSRNLLLGASAVAASSTATDQC